MFWSPDELAGSTAARLKQLNIENPGVLTYLPDELLAAHHITNEARPEDEMAEPPAAFEPAESKSKPEDNVGAQSGALWPIPSAPHT